MCILIHNYNLYFIDIEITFHISDIIGIRLRPQLSFIPIVQMCECVVSLVYPVKCI